jgi:dTMP kinase
MKPRFVSFEGIDGAGKSTHIEWAAEQLRAVGQTVIVTREPGGSELAERIRELVLTNEMSSMSELLMMFAARADHVSQVIEPALSQHQWVICDRFIDSTIAYQGGGRGMEAGMIESLASWVAGPCLPARTYLFDLPADQAAARRAQARDADRIESEELAFFDRVRQRYLALASTEPDRVLVVDSGDSIEHIRERLNLDLQALLAQWS